MSIEEIRKNIILTSSDEYIEEISEYFFNGSFIGKDIKDIRDLFATSHNNQYEKDDEDFKYFYDKVAYVDFCKYNNMAHNKLAAKKYLASSFNPQTREFYYNSNKFYKDGNPSLNTILVLNVKGKDIYKVLIAVYTLLRDNGVDNIITIPSFNRFKEGLTDSIRININVADMERVIGLIGDLPLPIINLMDKPSMLYPRVNDYIGYDTILSLDSGDEVRESYQVCKSIANALHNTIMNFLQHNGKELIENGGETIIDFRKRYLDDNKSSIEADLIILQRMITIDPSNKDIFINNLRESLLGSTLTRSAYITKEDNEVFDNIYGKLDDDSILFDKILEFDVKIPNIEIEDEPTLNQVPYVAPANELLVQEEQSNDLMVQEEQPTDLMVQEEHSTDLLVQEEKKELTPEGQPKEESINEQFSKREGTEEAYLDSLLASVQGGNQVNAESTEGPVVEEGPVEENKPEIVPLEEPVVADDSIKEDVHFYEGTASVGDNFVVSSTPAETTPVENISQDMQQGNVESELVRPEDMTDEQKKLVSDTYAEIPTDDTRFLEYLDDVLNKLPDTNSNVVSEESKEQLNQEEIQSLTSNPLEQQMTYERALKYKDLVSSISVLNTKVKGTDFTLLDYFDQQQLLTKIKPNASYMTFTDEVYNGLGIVENCVIKYVSNYGNVPLDKIFEEYGIQELEQTVKQDKIKGLKGLFKWKRS